MWDKEIAISDFKDKVFKSVKSDDNEIVFTEKTGKKYVMKHDQECSEEVYIEDICGDLKWLENTPIVRAYGTYSRGEAYDGYGDCTWTFYTFGTQKGHVTIRWYGTSNGYYSESAEIYKVSKEE